MRVNTDGTISRDEWEGGVSKGPVGPPRGHPPTTSAERYEVRLETFRKDGRPYPWLRHHAFWLIHNCVAHPLLALGPTVEAIEFHELTSQWLNNSRMHVAVGESTFRVARLHGVPHVEDRWSWVLHNVVAHLAIGLAPIGPSFRFHDWSAEQMGVPGWL